MRIVIKIGTSTITHPTGRLNIRQMEALCKVLSDLKNAGNEVILVSSGAIGMGVGKLRLVKKPADVPTKQASAAVGQCELMYTYDKLFSEYRHTVAQILLTADDIADPARHENFQNTIQRLLERYEGLSGHIQAQVMDPTRDPTFLDRYDLEISRLYENSVLAVCGERCRLVGYDEIYETSYSMDYSTYSYVSSTSFNGENALTNAIH